MLSPDNSRGQYLLSLADYYDHKCTDDAIVVYHLPRLLQEARLNGRLVEFLRKDPRARSIQAHTRAQYLKVIILHRLIPPSNVSQYKVYDNHLSYTYDVYLHGRLFAASTFVGMVSPGLLL